MTLEQSATGPNSGQAALGRVVFISSPFCEPKGSPWGIRRRLAEALEAECFTPWRFEVQGEMAKERLRLNDESAIRLGLQLADLVVVLYKRRAGSWMSVGSPFCGTDFEVVTAISLGKPVYLYVLGKEHESRLDGILALFLDPSVNLQEARYLETEDEIISAALKAAKDVVNWREPPPVSDHHIRCSSSDLDVSACEHLLERIRAAQAAEDLCLAVEAARMIPIQLPHATSTAHKRLYATLLDSCGNVWANYAWYERASRAAAMSVRLLMELEDWHGMFAQVQALSGILNMASERRAEALNLYGFRGAARAFPRLREAFNDSRASILRGMKRYMAARSSLERCIALQREPSVYTLSKYAGVLADIGGSRAIESGRRLMEDTVLPLAFSTGRSVSYALKEAAAIALADGDTKSALDYVTHGEHLCIARGLLHTRRRLQLVRARLVLS